MDAARRLRPPPHRGRRPHHHRPRRRHPLRSDALGDL
ncbi:hypothetical protein GMYAFLOJ_CDS0020 [Microbacterium phage phiMiGM15]